jgi:hypothetical protein
MTFHGLGLNNTASEVSASVTASSVIEQKLRLQMAVKGGAGWFLWVAGLSLINSILYFSGIRFQFIFGLGVAQFVSVLARRGGGAGFILALIINGFVAAVFVLFWHFARKSNKWAFWTGMGLYAVDGLLMLPFGAFLAVAFHAFALFWMFGGLAAISKLQELEETISPLSPPPITVAH